MSEEVVSDAANRAASYIKQGHSRRVFPDAAAIAGLAQFDEPLPEAGTDVFQVIAMLDDLGSPATVQTNGPRYFGFVTGGAMPVSRASAAIGAAWDQNGALPAMSPTAAALDTVSARWISEMLGFPDASTGVFCGGASEANLIALIAARDKVLLDAGWDAQADGLFGAPEVTVVLSAEAHISVVKALGLVGLGRRRSVVIGTDSQGRLDLGQLESAAVPDGPTILCLQAGNVNTGHSDPFEEAIAWAHRRGAWAHIDGAFGLWAAASPARANLVAGHQHANSWALDCHKWLNVPYDSALAYVADGAHLRSSMAAAADYIGDSVGRAPMHLGLQMSQRARAIDTWAAIKHLGRVGVSELIDNSCALASQFADGLASGGAEILHDVVLNQALARFDDDATTDAVVEAVQLEGTCWLGPTTWQGKRAARISVSGAETTSADIVASVSAILNCWQIVAEQH